MRSTNLSEIVGVSQKFRIAISVMDLAKEDRPLSFSALILATVFEPSI
jgi:hypothetical protein